jgi:DNA polymerase (family 10)
MREDRGELEVSETPRLIVVDDIKAELHSHTTASDGKMSIEESAKIAKSRGFHTLAITDHSQSSAVAGGLSPERLRKHIDAVREADKATKGISILAGSEVDILVDGTLDYDDDLLAELDVVVASPHAGLRAKPKQATKRLLKAIEHPLVHIIGHPTGRLIERRPGLDPDWNEIFAAAIEHDVALEINCHWMRLDLRDTHVRAAIEAGCTIAIDCDVHHADDYDNLRFGVMTGQRGWLTPEVCINTWSKQKLHGWLKSKR